MDEEKKMWEDELKETFEEYSMNDKKEDVWEFEGDWYISPKDSLTMCVNTEGAAKLLLGYLNNLEQKLKQARIDENIRNLDMFLSLPDSQFTDLGIGVILRNRIKQLEEGL